MNDLIKQSYDDLIDKVDRKKYLKEIYMKLTNMESRIETNCVDELNLKTKTLKKKMKDLRMKNQELIHQSKEVKLQLSEMNNKLNSLQQCSMNLEFHGIPEINNERLYRYFKNIANAIKMPIEDIFVMHRIPPNRKDLPGQIIIKFKSNECKQIWYSEIKNTQFRCEFFL